MARHTVQHAPFPLKQLNQLYGILVGGCLFLLFAFIRITSRITYVGKEHLKPNAAYIYTFWHENLPLHFTVNLRIREKQIWLQHPMLFMKPIHICAKLMGVKQLAYGSSGNSGKEALQRVNAHLRNGFSTMITPDGPHGPVRKLKPGVLLMARDTGIPIIPITMHASRQWTLHTWDRKKLPLPFSHIRITFHSPILVGPNFNEGDIRQLESVLSSDGAC